MWSVLIFLCEFRWRCMIKFKNIILIVEMIGNLKLKMRQTK